MMTKTRTLLAGLSGLAAVSCAAPDGAGPGEDEMTAVPAPVARTAQGAFLGAVMEDGSVRFKGIPYAAAPVGELRFRPPQPAPVPDGIVDATAETQPACAQADLGWNGDDRANMSEDCLVLAIRTPALAPEAPLPVMVFIHGGANLGGRGEWAVEGDLHQQGVVVASLQYRLGALGFMAHPSLSAESDSGASGNYGLMDQQAALRWIRENIAAFGGDPDNVTIFGSSAGSQGVALQMLAPGSRGLFDKAIQQSGTMGFGLPPRTLADGELLGMNIAEAAGLPRTASAGELRALSAERLFEGQWNAAFVGGVNNYEMFMAPLVDGAVLTQMPRAAALNGDAFPVPLMIGSSAMEYISVEAEDADAVIGARFGAHAGDAHAFYESAGDLPRLGDELMQLSSDLSYRCPTALAARLAAEAGRQVWLFQFDYEDADGPVSHGGESDYVFGFAEPAFGPLPLQQYWADFARDGNPNGDGLPAWPAYDPAGRAYLAFTNEGPVEDERLREPLCNWLEAM